MSKEYPYPPVEDSNMRPHIENLVFRKSSYSNARGQECVEVADLPTGAAVRDTQNRDLGHLTFPSQEWTALLNTTRIER